MASIINAGTTSNTALNMSADTSGTLDLQSNGTTMASVTSTGFNIGGVVASGFTMKNRIINGDMQIDQRNAGASVTVNVALNTFAVDRTFGTGTASAGVFTMAQSSIAPAGFSRSLLITVTTADASLAASDLYMLGQNIEGFNTADLNFGTANAATITLSFWVRSSVTGTYGGSFLNEGVTRSYPYTYTISAANTWEKKTITIPGDTTGTWTGSTNGVGLRVSFGLGAGSTFSGTAGSWQSADFRSASGVTNLMATNGATFYITGVQLERGSQATSFEWLPYGTELALCQRYFYCIGGAFNGSLANQYYAPGYMSGTTQFIGVIQLPVTMRTAPSFSAINPSNFVVFSGGVTLACSSVLLDVSSPTTMGIYTANSAGTAYQGSRIIQNSTNASQMQFSAEL